MRTRIKICGLTRLEDISIAISEGADAIGLMHYEKSPRYLDLKAAKVLRDAVPPFVDTVSVVANADKGQIESIIEKVLPDYIQFHGDETADFCNQFDYPYIRAVRVRQPIDIENAFAHYSKASAFLLDAYDENSFGGAGIAFDWNLIPAEYRSKIILAGGLKAENVAKAIENIRPYAVDVSSGVETEVGVKDPQKIIAFINAVNDTLNI